MSLEVNTSENGENTAEIHSFIEQIAISRGIEEFVYTAESLYGNFITNIYSVVISDTYKNSTETVDVIVKTLINSIRQESYLNIHKRECLAYAKVIPKFKKNINEENSKLYLPECLSFSDEKDKEVIILEQLRNKRFEECRLNRYLMFDYDHFSIVFSELAKFHALSFIFEETQPDLYNKAVNEFRDVIFQDKFLNKTKLRNYFTESFKQCLQQVKNVEAKIKLQKIKVELIRLIQNFLKPAKFNVLCHGDLWMKNIMFHYEDNKPTRLCFIDFQAMRYANPVIDIYYFLYLNTDAKFRSDHFDDLLNVYHRNHTEFLKEHDIDAENVYPKEQFYKDLKDFKAYGLLITLTHLKAVTLTPENEAIDHGSKLIGHDDLGTVPGENVLFAQRVNDIVEEFISNGVIDDILNKL